MTIPTTPAVQTPAPTEHPSVSAPKCIDCKHHRLRQRDMAWQARDLCAHPRYSRSLITGEPIHLCADMRGGHTVSADGLPPCGPAGTLYEPATDEAQP